MIQDDQSLDSATMRGHKLRVWDEGFGPLWVYRESVGALGVVRAETWEKAYSCVVDEIMDDGDLDDEDGEPENLSEGLHWRGSGVPSNEGLESPLAQEDLGGSLLDRLTPALAAELGVVVEISDDFSSKGMPGEHCPGCGKDYEGRKLSEPCDCDKG